jgi:hypothetical protein
MSMNATRQPFPLPNRLARRLDLGALLRREKSFSHEVIGQPWLNAMGLHLWRVKMSDASVAWRKRRQPDAAPEDGGKLARLATHGVALWPDFLPAAEFVQLQLEIKQRLQELERERPLPRDADPGFGPKRPFAGGFDRFDGGSLNRFLAIDPNQTPHSHALVSSARLLALCVAGSTLRPAVSKFWIQQLVQGGATVHFDVQQELHRDTFHAAYKLWYFVDEVRREHGPFEYVEGSQHMTAQRLWWEYRRSLRARSLDAESKNGSFRIAESELAALGLGAARAFPVPANTLLIADVRGFHRRGAAQAGAARLAIHANLRPHPFKP